MELSLAVSHGRNQSEKWVKQIEEKNGSKLINFFFRFHDYVLLKYNFNKIKIKFTKEGNFIPLPLNYYYINWSNFASQNMYVFREFKLFLLT